MALQNNGSKNYRFRTGEKTVSGAESPFPWWQRTSRAAGGHVGPEWLEASNTHLVSLQTSVKS